MIVNAVPGQTVASSQVTRSNYTLQLTTSRFGRRATVQSEPPSLAVGRQGKRHHAKLVRSIAIVVNVVGGGGRDRLWSNK